MTRHVRVATLQERECSDSKGALLRIEAGVKKAEAENSSLVCFPECFLQGYPRDRTVAYEISVDLSSEAFRTLLGRLEHRRAAIVVGLVEREGRNLYNTAIVVKGGVLLGRYRKRHLIASDAAFRPGLASPLFEVDGLRFGLLICHDANYADRYLELKSQGAIAAICLANNMLPTDVALEWESKHSEIRQSFARAHGMWVASSDVTGETLDRIALGPTSVIDPLGSVVAQVAVGDVGMVTHDIPLIGREDV